MPSSWESVRRFCALCRSRFLHGAALFMLLWLSAYANAAVIQGTFSGIAFNSRINAEAPWASNFDGQSVTGTFFFDPYDQGEFWPVVRPGSLELVFYAAGQRVVFNSLNEGGGLVNHSTTSDPQYIQMSPGALYPYYNASLLLAGPLFSDDSLESLHAAPIDLENSWAYFFAGRSFGASVRLTSVSFDGVSVPEPPALALVAGGLSLLALFSRNRRYRRS